MANSIEPSILNMSINDLSGDELLTEFNKLRKNAEIEQEEMEKLNQELHDAQREISRLTSLEKDYIDEIQELQINEDIEDENVQIQMAEDKIRMVRQNNQESMNDLRQQMIETTEAIQETEDQLKRLKSNISTGTESEQITTENIKLRADTEILKQEVDNIQHHIEHFKGGNQLLLQQINEMHNEIECLQESLDYSSSELSSCKDSIESLQCEIALLRIEIDSIKSVPLDAASRGNSLFAEVHDRRVQLEDKLSAMKTAYLGMQVEYETQLRQIECLEGENLELTKLWEQDLYLSKKQNGNDDWYKEQLDKLELIVESKRSKLNERFAYKTKDIATAEETYIINYYNKKEKLIVKSLDELLLCVKERIELAQELSSSNIMEREHQLKVVQSECETTNIKTDRDSLYVERKINAHCNCERQHSKKTFNMVNFARKDDSLFQKFESKVKPLDFKVLLSSNKRDITNGIKSNSKTMVDLKISADSKKRAK